MTTLNELFDQFVRERTYLNNVTPKTREWYLLSREALGEFQEVAHEGRLRTGELKLMPKNDREVAGDVRVAALQVFGASPRLGLSRRASRRIRRHRARGR